MKSPEQLREVIDFLTVARPDDPLIPLLTAIVGTGEKCAWQLKYEALLHNSQNEAALAKARIEELQDKLAKFTGKGGG